jgi:hypothetical protein
MHQWFWILRYSLEENDEQIWVKLDSNKIWSWRLNQSLSRTHHHRRCFETICKSYFFLKKKELIEWKWSKYYPAARISSSVFRYLNIDNNVSSGNRKINASCWIYSSRSSRLRFIRVFKDIEVNRSRYSNKQVSVYIISV